MKWDKWLWFDRWWANLIAPSPDNDLEPLIIAPIDTTENEKALSEDNSFTTGLY